MPYVYSNCFVVNTLQLFTLAGCIISCISCNRSTGWMCTRYIYVISVCIFCSWLTLFSTFRLKKEKFQLTLNKINSNSFLDISDRTRFQLPTLKNGLHGVSSDKVKKHECGVLFSFTHTFMLIGLCYMSENNNC